MAIAVPGAIVPRDIGARCCPTLTLARQCNPSEPSNAVSEGTCVLVFAQTKDPIDAWPCDAGAQTCVIQVVDVRGRGGVLKLPKLPKLGTSHP